MSTNRSVTVAKQKLLIPPDLFARDGGVFYNKTDVL